MVACAPGQSAVGDAVIEPGKFSPNWVIVIVALALTVPPDPVQVRVNVPELVKAPLDSLPEAALLPDHAPEAAQELASVEDQVSVDDLPVATRLGFAASDTVGTGKTVTVVETLALPPEPVQVRE